MTPPSAPRSLASSAVARRTLGSPRPSTICPPSWRADKWRATATQPWQQVEHMRLAAEDLVAYCERSDYAAREFPAGYWPDGPEPPSAEAWSASVQGLLDITEQMARMVEDPDRDLYAKVPTAEKASHHTLRAALILLDHNGYHAGQLIALRRALDTWRP